MDHPIIMIIIRIYHVSYKILYKNKFIDLLLQIEDPEETGQAHIIIYTRTRAHTHIEGI